MQVLYEEREIEELTRGSVRHRMKGGSARKTIRSQCDDSNAIIMSAKRESTKQNRKQKSRNIMTQRTRTLSKSQKRKLGKFEEDKEKSFLLKKTFENLEKYKIPEKAYSLLQSSSSIGQGETMRQKRMKAVQFLKAGICGSSDYHIINFMGDNNSTISETGTDLDQGLAEFDDSSESLHLAMKDNVLSDLHINVVCDASIPVKDDSTFNSAMFVRENLPISCINDENILKPLIEAKKNEVGINCRCRCQCRSLNNLSSVPIVVHAARPMHIDDQRKDLPIVMMEQEIMEAINENPAVIICGETGCGKTTQVPQFLYEAGYGSNQSILRRGIIGVTQPRRVAALATAKRVAFELGFHLGKEVGFQVRHDKKIGHNCSIKFMTDGILLREVQTDILLRRYSVIILDEAHERSLNTDILIGMLSRVIKIREQVFEEQQQKKLLGENIGPESMIFPLKIVLMSATLRVDDFVSGKKIFCCPPPVIEVPARQFPVTTHFSKRTEIVDYIGQAYKKVLSIHKRLPPGGILVFVTGQREVEYLCQKLRKASKGLLRNCSGKKIGINEAFNPDMEGVNMNEINEAFNIHGISDNQKTDRFSSYEEDHGDPIEDELELSYDSQSMTESEVEDEGGSNKATSVLGKDENLASLKAAFEALAGNSTSNPNLEIHQVANTDISDGQPKELDPSFVKAKNRENGVHVGMLCVLPLYAMLPAAAQLRVFDEIKEGERLVVVATNVAETSLTIPGIKYVVDTGREKVKNYNPSNGMESYEVQWISKASASQRTGRAGRTGPGHCYRLYSSAAFSNIFPDFSVPEISKIPVDGVVLLMKSMGIDRVVNFPFPTPPLHAALVEAECCLKTLQALDGNGRLTSLGMAMARFPMSPRHSRMLLTVIQITRQLKNRVRPDLVLCYAFAAASALSFPTPFLIQFDGDSSNIEGEGMEFADAQGNPNPSKKPRKKKLKETVKASRVKFSNPNSDALSVAYALQCFDLSTNPLEFCNEYALHLKTMDEMSKLRKQLLGLLFNVHNNNNEGEFSWNHGTFEDVEFAWRSNNGHRYPLLLDEEEILCQAICAGWADRTAKRFRPVSGSSEGDRRHNAARYQASMVKDPVFLHRWSSLSNSAPEFLVYNELMHTKRPYMRGATSVKPDWLVKYAASSCTFSAPVEDPKPYYEPFQDDLFCWVFPTFGPHLWHLPLHGLPICKPAIRVKVFAYALLEGRVCPCLKGAREFMAAAPGLVLRPEALGQRRVGNLLNKMDSRVRRIDSCAMLREAWEENPMELHSEILDWFQEGFHLQFEEIWSMMQREIVLEPRERFARREKIKLNKL